MALRSRSRGNLSSHLSKLEEARLVEIEKRFVEKKPQTLVRLSEGGRRTIEGYWNEMKELHENVVHWQMLEAVPA